MPIPLLRVLREVVVETGNIDQDRVANQKPVDFSQDVIQDAMVYMHCAWQELMMTIKAGKDLPETAILPSIKLAAASAKFAADLGTVRLFEALQKHQAYRREMLLGKVKKIGNHLLTYLGIRSVKAV